MTIKKRLFWSNIFMIAVPAVSTILVGLLCVGAVWLFLTGGAGLEVDDLEDFEEVGMAVSALVEYDIRRGNDFAAVKPILDNGRMAVKIVSEGKTLVEYGKAEEVDGALLSAAGLLDGHVVIAQDGRSLYVRTERMGNAEYTIYLFGHYDERQTYSELKKVLVLAVIMVGFTIFLSILLTNRFLTGFVFKRIEEPLDVLADGVREIRNGNLEYRIPYDREDEFLAVCRDFNEMAVRLKRSVDGMQRQEQSRKELVAGISHDLRSPLTSIQAYVEGLLDGVAKTSEAQQRYLETIKGKAEDLAHIISQLFLFSKMELGEYPENPVLFSLDEKIAETIFALKEDYAGQGMTISLELEPVEIYGDPLDLHRIITNILENSLKYKGKKQGNMWIRLEQTAAGGRLSFADDGPGVPREALPHLFEVFYRSDPARQNPDQGSGLGLAIVANAVRRMGGRIRALCHEPCGLEIRIDFPKPPEEVQEVHRDGKNTDYRR